MNFRIMYRWLWSFIGTVSLWCHGQVPAPAALPPCLIQYSGSQLDVGYSRLIAYNSDSTYVEINSFNDRPDPGSTQPTSAGTYTYAVDPQNPDHAIISYQSAQGSPSNDDLYFADANTGAQTPSGEASIPGTAAFFHLYRSQGTNGGSNLSSLGQVAPAGPATVGFVVQSGGPRWVLIRAVGASLAQFGVPAPASAPLFTLYDSNQAAVGNAVVWSADPNLRPGFASVFSLVGAFQLKSGSDDSVLLKALVPGAYTAVVSVGGAGAVLAEIYFLPF